MCNLINRDTFTFEHVRLKYQHLMYFHVTLHVYELISIIINIGKCETTGYFEQHVGTVSSFVHGDKNRSAKTST